MDMSVKKIAEESQSIIVVIYLGSNGQAKLLYANARIYYCPNIIHLVL